MGDPSYWLPASIALSAAFGGIGAILVLSQDRTRPNVALALAFLAVGVVSPTTLLLVDEVDPSDPGWLARLQGLPEVVGMLACALYLDSLRSTGQVSKRADRIVRWIFRAAVGLAAWHTVAALAFPAQRLNDYALSALDPGAHDEPGFWLFAAFWIVVTFVFVIGWLALASQRLDPAESDRAVASAVSSPFLVLATAMPPAISLACLLVSALLVLWGQFQYTVAQARRSVFLGRFLSPRVTELVHAHGLASVMQPHQAELTVVAADLRNFTSYAEGVPSQAVVDLLTEYYDAAGAVVARHGGTITAYAGDGILILVGAPLPRADHAVAALKLARELQLAVQPVLLRWATKIHPLGLGVGVASGHATVGTIATSERMEYTAIGTPVNLAARLCSAAAAGEVLVDESAARLGNAATVERGTMAIKGLTGPQTVFALGESAEGNAQVVRGAATFSTEPGSTTS